MDVYWRNLEAVISESGSVVLADWRVIGPPRLTLVQESTNVRACHDAHVIIAHADRHLVAAGPRA